jgi:hypothetical protein
MSGLAISFRDPLAGLADAEVLENVGLSLQLRGHEWPGLSNVTTIFAGAKYGLLIVLGLGLVALGLCVLLDCPSA